MTVPVAEPPVTVVAVAEVTPEPVVESHDVLEAAQSHDIGELHGMVTQIAERLGGMESRLNYIEECARTAEKTAEEAEEVAEVAVEIAVEAAVEAVEAVETVEEVEPVNETVTEIEVESEASPATEESVEEPAPARRRSRPYGKRR